MSRARRRPVRLVLDEMHSSVVAAELRRRGQDVVAVAEDPVLRGMDDRELFRWAVREGRRHVTEDVKDFRPILHAAQESGEGTVGVLFTTPGTFPRSRRNPGPLIVALDAWLHRRDVRRRPIEDWLRAE